MVCEYKAVGKHPPIAPLSDGTVREIRRFVADGNGPTVTAVVFGVHKCTVIDIVKRRRYGYVE